MLTRYEQLNLVAHLSAAGRHDDVHKLLRLTREVPIEVAPASERYRLGGHRLDVAGGLGKPRLTRNYWWDAFERLGLTTAYFDDLQRARESASFGLEIRYVLMAASIVDLAGLVDPDLLRMLVDIGAWAPPRALGHARRMSDPVDRAKALTVVAGLVDQAERPVICGEVLESLRACERLRAQSLLIAVAPLLPDELVDEAALLIRASSYGESALPALAPRIGTDMMRRLLDGCRDTPELFQRESARIIGYLAPYLPAPMVRQAFAITTEFAKDTDRAEALTGLSPVLPADLLPEALRFIGAHQGSSSRSRPFGTIVPRLAPELLPLALEIALAMDDWQDMGFALDALAPRLPADLLAMAVREIEVQPSYLRGRALAALAPYLDAAVVLSLVSDLSDEDQADLVARLWPRLPDALRPDVVSLVEALDDPRARAGALAVTWDAFPPDRRRELVDELRAGYDPVPELSLLLRRVAAEDPDAALRNLALLGPRLDGGDVLRELAPRLAADRFPELLDLVRKLSIGYDRAHVLADIAPHVPASMVPDAVRAVRDPAWLHLALEHLAPVMDEDGLRTGLSAAEAIAKPYPDYVSESFAARALAALAPRLTGPLMAEAVRIAANLPDDRARAEALQALAPWLTGDHLTAALAATATVVDGPAWSRTMCVFAPRVPEPDRTAMVDAVTTLRAISDYPEVTRTLATYAAFLDDDQMERALAGVERMATGRYTDRGEALAALAPYLPDHLLPRAVAAATASERDDQREMALLALAPRTTVELPAMEPPRIRRLEMFVRQAQAGLDASVSQWIDTDEEETGPYTDVAAFDAAWRTAATSRSDADWDRQWRALSLYRLTRVAPAERWESAARDAIKAAYDIQDRGDRVRAIARASTLVPAIGVDLMDDAWAVLAEMPPGDGRAWTVAEIVTYVDRMRLPSALLAAMREATMSARDESRPTCLRHLAEPLTRITEAEARPVWRVWTAAAARRSRRHALADLRALLPYVMHAGGEPAAREVGRAVDEVSEWWP